VLLPCEVNFTIRIVSRCERLWPFIETSRRVRAWCSFRCGILGSLLLGSLSMVRYLALGGEFDLMLDAALLATAPSTASMRL
jgi:hypothetical protein